MVLCSYLTTCNEDMALNIRNPEAERLAAELATRTGETKTDAVIKALQERLERVQARQAKSRRGALNELNEIARHCAALPLRDQRTDNDILGYDDRGLPR